MIVFATFSGSQVGETPRTRLCIREILRQVTV